jgi:hypothetical protein
MKNLEPKHDGFNKNPNIAYNLTYEFMNFMFFAYRMGLIIQSACMNSTHNNHYQTKPFLETWKFSLVFQTM